MLNNMKKILIFSLFILILLVGCKNTTINNETDTKEETINDVNTNNSNTYEHLKISDKIHNDRITKRFETIPDSIKEGVADKIREDKDKKENEAIVNETNKENEILQSQAITEEKQSIIQESEEEKTEYIEENKHNGNDDYITVEDNVKNNIKDIELFNEVKEDIILEQSLTLSEYIEEEQPKKKLFAGSLSATQYWVYDVIVRAYDNSRGQVRQALAARGYSDSFATQFLNAGVPVRVGSFPTQDAAQQFIHSLEFYANAKCDIKRVELK